MSDSSAPATPPIVLDDEGKRLQLEAEKAKLRSSIAASRQQADSIEAAQLSVPALTGAATGTTSIGEQAGAYGSVLASETLTAAAAEMAVAVRERIDSQIAPLLPGRTRVLVVDDRSLLIGMMAGQRCRATVARRLTQLRALLTELEQAAAALSLAVDGLQGESDLVDDHPLEGRGEGAGDEGGGAKGGGGEGGVAGSGGAVGAALTSAANLFSLAAVDHALSSVPVTTSPSHLVGATVAALTSGSSPDGGTLEVFVDGYTAARPSATLGAYEQLCKAMDDTRRALTTLNAQLRPIEAQVDSLRTRLGTIEIGWSTWATAKDRSADGGSLLEAKHGALTALAAQRQAAVAPARAASDRAGLTLDQCEADIASIIGGTGAESSLVSAVRWERTAAGIIDPVTYVLFVESRQLAADSLTRRSVLGTSSRLTFMAAAATSWLLLDPESGIVVGGRDHAVRQQLRLDLDAGSIEGPSKPSAEALGRDPLSTIENVVRVLVLITALALVFLAVCGGIALLPG